MPLYPATERDYAEAIEVINLAYRGAGPAASWNIEAGIIAGERINDSLLREELAANPHAHFLTFKDAPDAPLLGTAWLDPMPDGTWYLGLLSVRADLQNRQLGRTLLAEAEAFAKQRGANRIRMTVLHVRDALIAWYGRRGYTVTGETRPYPYGRDERFGKPLRDDLYFHVLEKHL